MLNKKDLKFLLRSKSFNLLRDTKKEGLIGSYLYNNKPITYRAGSSDIEIIYEILLKKGKKSEYWLPSCLSPNVIFDIGGNIGITSILLANQFPNAKIFTFEPMKENFEILTKNINHYPNVKAFNVALGDENKEIEMFLSDNSSNFGGGSLYEKGVNLNQTEKVQMMTVGTVLEKEKIDTVDIIKIDTEGAEYNILSSFPKSILSNLTWLVGELHGIDDFKLLNLLQDKFDISVKKKINNRLFMFNASNKQFTKNLTKSDIKNL